MRYIINRPGERNELKTVTLVAEEKVRKSIRKRKITPARSLKVWNHSPTGFEFGYGGSGPAQLALAILLDFTNDSELASRYHQSFKWDFICRLDHPGGEIEGQQIKYWLEEKEREQNDKSNTN